MKRTKRLTRTQKRLQKRHAVPDRLMPRGVRQHGSVELFMWLRERLERIGRSE